MLNRVYMAPAIAIIKQAAVSGDVHLRRLAALISSSLIPFLEQAAEEGLWAGEWAFSQGSYSM